jgi:biopolymer transport protein ExbD
MFLNKANRNDSEIPTASLADIVFLLLIFFLVVTSIDTEKGLNLILPKNDDTRPVDENKIVSVLINNQGDIALSGVPVSIHELPSILRERLAEHPDLVVSLKTDKGTAYERYITVLDILNESWGSRKPQISILLSEE